MNPVTMVIICGALVSLIIIIMIIIIKSFNSPQKIEGIQKAIKDGKLQNAQKIAKSLISKNPRDYVAHYLLGKTYMADGKPELAFVEYKTVNDNALFNGDIPETEFRKTMAELYRKYNQNHDALREYLLLTKLDPTNAENNYNAGKLYEEDGKNQLAMGFYQKALSIDKKLSKAHTAMGYLLLRGKQYAEARNEIETAIRQNPEDYSNYYYLGKILKETHELAAAVKAFEKAQRDQEFRQRSFIEKGSCLVSAGQMDQAESEFIHAINCTKSESSQETLYARYFLAACYENNRKIEKAIEQWNIIFNKNRQFKDVSAKLNQYKDVQTNDNIKEYLTCTPAAFVELCKKTAKAGFNLEAQKVEPTKNGCIMLATEEKKDNWMNMRQQIFYVEFLRDTEPIEESTVRKAADLIKRQGCAKGIIITSSKFTPGAAAFAENRPVILAAKEQLE
ncbi:MAG: tetratricopeptide repeat protein, partial [Treponema sp.]|nr:tetratricopeptide repeat protein [Treponema sp.]